MTHPADIGFVCDPDQYAVFASTLWEVARSATADLDASESPLTGTGLTAPAGAVPTAGDGWAEWATDPDWAVS